MIYRFTLTYNAVDTSVIEPKGWKDFESEIKRDFKSHGVVYEFTSGTLKLGFADGRDVLENAFQTEGNEALVYFLAESKTHEYGTWETEFYGSAVMKNRELNGQYFEVDFEGSSIKQLITNRLKTKVNLGTTLDLDGGTLSGSLTSYTNDWDTIRLYNDYQAKLAVDTSSTITPIASAEGTSENDATSIKLLYSYWGYPYEIFNNFKDIKRSDLDMVNTSLSFDDDTITPIAVLLYGGDVTISGTLFFKVDYTLLSGGSPSSIDLFANLWVVRYRPSDMSSDVRNVYTHSYSAPLSSPLNYTLEGSFSLPEAASYDEIFTDCLPSDEFYVTLLTSSTEIGGTGNVLTTTVYLYGTNVLPI